MAQRAEAVGTQRAGGSGIVDSQDPPIVGFAVSDNLEATQLDRADRWFDQYENWAVFVGRITPVVRSFVSIPAGVFRVGLARYTILTLAGSALWCFTLAGVGWGLGASYERFHHDFGYAEVVVVAGVLLVAAYLVVRRRRSPTLS